jgi:hypothetical protein
MAGEKAGNDAMTVRVQSCAPSADDLERRKLIVGKGRSAVGAAAVDDAGP